VAPRARERFAAEPRRRGTSFRDQSIRALEGSCRRNLYFFYERRGDRWLTDFLDPDEANWRLPEARRGALAPVYDFVRDRFGAQVPAKWRGPETDAAPASGA
jgi:hypothetical protein